MREGNRNGNGDGDENGDEGGGGRESRNLQSDSGGGVEDTIEGVTPTSDHQPQPQDPMLQQKCRVMRRTSAQGWEAEDGTGERGEGLKNAAINPRRVV